MLRRLQALADVDLEVLVLSLTTIVVSFVLMFVNVGAKPFWVDEAIAVLPAQSILTEGVPRNPFDLNYMAPQLEDDLWDPSAPLYRYSVAAVAFVFGFSETSTRGWSVFLAVVMLVPCYLLFRRLYGGLTALLAVTFLSATPHFADFAREARHFTFVGCMMAFTFYFLSTASMKAGRESSRGLWPVLLVMTLLGHALGYITLPIVTAFFAALWVVDGETRLLSKRYISAYAAVTALYAAILVKYGNTLPFFHSIGCYNRPSGCQPNPFYYVGTLLNFLNGADFRPGTPLSIVATNLSIPILLLGIGLVACIRPARDRGELGPSHVLVLAWFALPLILLSTREVKFPRYLFYILPPMTLFMARGVVKLSEWRLLQRVRRPVGALLLAIVVLAPRSKGSDLGGGRESGFMLRYVTHAIDTSFPEDPDNWQRIGAQVEFLQKNASPDDIVVTSLDDGSLGYYLGRFVYGFLNSEHDDDFFVGLLAQASEKGNRLWFIDTLPFHNYCHTPGNRPMNVDCREKYQRFYEACRPSSPTFDETCRRLRFP